MIKLKVPYNYKGGLVAAGTVLPLSPDIEKKMVESGTAEYFNTAVLKAETLTEDDKKKSSTVLGDKKEKSSTVLGDKNAKEAIAFVNSLDSIEELHGLFLEETEGKNRSTVISAIKGRATQLAEQDDKNPKNDKGPKDDEDPKNHKDTENPKVQDDKIVS